jgi:opacity protein-like surface antigen
MRRFLLAAMMCGAVSGAQAADLSDLPILRGAFTEGLSRSSINWQGVYIGGHVSQGAADMDFTNTTKDLVAKLVNNSGIDATFNTSNWPLLGKAHAASSTGYGGFAGYNFQWTDALIGVELNYTHGLFAASSTGSQTRSSTSNNVTTNVIAVSDGSMRVTDFGSLRLRGGYAVGNFLPYGFVGVGMGQADINRSAEIIVRYDAPGVPSTYATPRMFVADNANAHFVTGFAAGLGIDVMLYAGLFLRAEWEYIRFTSVVDTNVNTVRAGLGYKF